jgi:putative endonuclease
MSRASTYYVYILASGRHGTLYIGVTNNLRARLEQHRKGHGGSEFVKKYRVHRLVHVETFASPLEAIAREKQLKNWHRDWKIRLIEENNLDWSDLSHLLEQRVIMGPGLRRDDGRIIAMALSPHIADSILSPQ